MALVMNIEAGKRLFGSRNLECSLEHKIKQQWVVVIDLFERFALVLIEIAEL